MDRPHPDTADDEMNVMERLAVEPWLDDEDKFGRHFGIAYEDFMTLVTVLSAEQVEKYEKIRRVNIEAAILWAIHEGRSHGLLQEDQDD